MIKTMKRSLVLVLAVAVAALSAIAVPSMASAANWGPLNTIHSLTSPSSLTFNIPALGSSISCSSGPTFTAQVRTPASSLMDLTSTTNLSCTATGVLAGCSIPLAMIGLPVWSVDGTSTTNVKVNSVNIEARQGSCGNVGPFTMSGQLAGGVWSNLTRSLAFTNGTGLTMMGVYPVTVTSSEFIKDTTSPFLSL
jgi:hypothetical protein